MKYILIISLFILAGITRISAQVDFGKCCASRKCLDSVKSLVEVFNQKDQSPLFVVNEKYIFKMDVLSLQESKSFMDKYLVASKLEMFSVCDSVIGTTVWGSVASKGLVAIKLKSNVTFDPIDVNINEKAINRYYINWEPNPKPIPPPVRNTWMKCCASYNEASAWMGNIMVGLRSLGYYDIMGTVLQTASGFCAFITEGGPLEM